MSDLPFAIDKSLIDQFKKGTSATEALSEDEIQEAKFVLTAAINSSLQNYENVILKTYKSHTTIYNVAVEEVIHFNNIYEGLHFGYIVAWKNHWTKHGFSITLPLF